MVRLRQALAILLVAVCAPVALAAGPEPGLGRFALVRTAPVKTSVYVAIVSLAATDFVRHGPDYLADYRVKVFPFFFYDEHGRLVVPVSDADLRRLASGQPFDFSGQGIRSDGKVRLVDGRVTPRGPATGDIQVRVHASRHFTLVFNTTYRLPAAPLTATGARTPAAP